VSKTRVGPLDAERERSIIASVRAWEGGDGAMTNAAREHGISRQRAWQIVRAYEARTGETVRPKPESRPAEKRRPARTPLGDGPPAGRRCTKCGVLAETPEQVAALFYPKRKGGVVVGYREACKECSKAASIQYLKDNPHKQDKWRSYYAKRARERRKTQPGG
jgi:hypothetical protein